MEHIKQAVMEPSLRERRRIGHQFTQESLAKLKIRGDDFLTSTEEDMFQEMLIRHGKAFALTPDEIGCVDPSIIVPMVGTTPDGVPNILFEGSYEGFNNDQITGWSSCPGMGHYRWLRGPINHLQREQRSEYVANTIRHIIDFLNI
uniref:Predicted protein n=1 Tax=Physcomitrium patens TaxID=3218 RepID=A9U4X1_PHYPA